MKTARISWRSFLFLLLATACPATAGMMDNWITKQVNTTRFALTYVVRGDNRYVA